MKEVAVCACRNYLLENRSASKNPGAYIHCTWTHLSVHIWITVLNGWQYPLFDTDDQEDHQETLITQINQTFLSSRLVWWVPVLNLLPLYTLCSHFYFDMLLYGNTDVNYEINYEINFLFKLIMKLISYEINENCGRLGYLNRTEPLLMSLVTHLFHECSPTPLSLTYPASSVLLTIWLSTPCTTWWWMQWQNYWMYSRSRYV